MVAASSEVANFYSRCIDRDGRPPKGERLHLPSRSSSNTKTGRSHSTVRHALFVIPFCRTSTNAYEARWRSSALVICSFGTAPTICSTTCPFLNTSSVGMPRML